VRKESRMIIIKDHVGEEEVVETTIMTTEIMIKVKERSKRERQDHTEEEEPVVLIVATEEAVIEDEEKEVLEATKEEQVKEADTIGGVDVGLVEVEVEHITMGITREYSTNQPEKSM
jgi:hypothetical protein